MKQPDSVELDSTDLAMWLSRLACRLRNDGLALVGRASLESSPGKQEYEDLAEIWNSLERAASILDAVQDRLCSGCQLLEVSEQLAFGTVSEARIQSPEQKGKSHKQKKGNDCNIGREGKRRHGLRKRTENDRGPRMRD